MPTSRAWPRSWPRTATCRSGSWAGGTGSSSTGASTPSRPSRSEEHTSELQSQSNLVCRPLLEKERTINPNPQHGYFQQRAFTALSKNPPAVFVDAVDKNNFGYDYPPSTSHEKLPSARDCLAHP